MHAPTGVTQNLRSVTNPGRRDHALHHSTPKISRKGKITVAGMKSGIVIRTEEGIGWGWATQGAFVVAEMSSILIVGVAHGCVPLSRPVELYPSIGDI